MSLERNRTRDVTAEPAVSCSGVRRHFGRVVALDGADLMVAPGTLTALIGPSGCGKTTLLRAIAGFEVPDGGEIDVNGVRVSGSGRFVPPRARGIGMVFQDYALFPHMDVAANVGYALGRRPEQHRVEQMLEVVGLQGLGRRRLDQLSGGQQQRVALARALVARPGVVLLDEPFSNLDAILRQRVRGEVREILKEAGVSALLVTHDQEEALSVADRLAVMRDGRVLQEGEPDHVYHHPASRWVAGFLGAVEHIRGSAHAGVVTTGLGSVELVDAPTGPVDVLVRPEDIGLGALDTVAPPGAATGTIVRREFFGHAQLVTVDVPGEGRVRHRGAGHVRWQEGDRVAVWLAGPVTVLPSEGVPAPSPSPDHA
ncbi:MAG: ABC transporter ATP-binding protein [Thermoleophilia bacterium]